MTRSATCSCGQLKAIVTGEPNRVSICHCLECKRRTGSAFSYNATYDSSQVATEGASRQYIRASEEGFWGRHSFCPDCGCTVFYEIERRPGMITIPVGAFADPGFPEPSVSVYDERRHRWIELRPKGTLQFQ